MAFVLYGAMFLFVAVVGLLATITNIRESTPLAYVVAFGGMFLFVAVVAVLAAIINRKARKRDLDREYLFRQFIQTHGWVEDTQSEVGAIKPRTLLPSPFRFSTNNLSSFSHIATTVRNGFRLWLIIERLYPTPGVIGESSHAPPLESQIWMTYAIAQFSKQLPGFVRIGPENMLSRMKPDVELESVQFNRDVFILSRPPKYAFAVLPPDFMEWYGDLENKPWVTIEGQACSIVIKESLEATTLDQFANQVLKIASFIERSSALEKKAEPLSPRLA